LGQNCEVYGGIPANSRTVTEREGIDPLSLDSDTTRPAIVTFAEAKRLLGGVSPQTIYCLVADGQLELVKIRRRSFVTRSSVENLIQTATRPTRPSRGSSLHAPADGRGGTAEAGPPQ
jgi:hypothetical protein